MLIMYGIIINTVRKTMKGQTDISEKDQKRAQQAMDRLRGALGSRWALETWD